jgi:starvation-inducible DNA-binding protein
MAECNSIHIGIDETERSSITEGLSSLLADTYTPHLTTRNLHWNATVQMFNTLHLVFMTQHAEIWNSIDPIAERIRLLGFPAPGFYAQFAELASISDAPTQPAAALEMVRILVGVHESVARTARHVHPLTFRNHDERTADLLTQRLTAHEKAAWMLRSIFAD